MGGLRESSTIRLCDRLALRLLASVFLALLLTANRVRMVTAGGCNTTLSPATWREESTVVFQGRIVEIHGADRNVYSTSGARMEVQRVWKGDLPSYVDLSTSPPNFVEPTRYFMPGVEYLVYAQGHAPALTVQVCSPMKPVSQARNEILYLDYGIPIRWSERLAVLLAAVVSHILLLDGLLRWRGRSSARVAAGTG